MHQNNLAIFKQHVLPILQPGHLLLDVGAVERVPHLRDAVEEAGLQIAWYTADLSNERLGHPMVIEMGDENSLLCPDDRFHYVLSSQAIEHVKRPWIWLPDLARVLRPGGTLIILCPVGWKYHKNPVDCWRIMPDGMRALLEDAGLVEERIEILNMGVDTGREQRNQLNPGKVYDLLTIATKPPHHS